jgi:hypothetical protein
MRAINLTGVHERHAKLLTTTAERLMREWRTTKHVDDHT